MCVCTASIGEVRSCLHKGSERRKKAQAKLVTSVLGREKRRKVEKKTDNKGCFEGGQTKRSEEKEDK